VRHEVDAAAVDRYAPALASAGLLLGRATDGAPALLRMLRARPTRITAVGGLWLARLLTFRAFALGARVLVHTVDPRRWQGLGQAATGSADRLRVVDRQSGHALGDWAGPVLHVLDLDGHPAGDFAPTGAWHTALTVAAELTGPVAEALPGADAVVVQRMWPQQAAHAAAALGIAPDAVAPVANLPDDMVAVLTPRASLFVRLVPTAVERRMFGAPLR
jgi:hypothetical protein